MQLKVPKKNGYRHWALQGRRPRILFLSKGEYPNISVYFLKLLPKFFPA
jgi:hypothetical protein